MKLVFTFSTFWIIYFCYSTWGALAMFEEKKQYETMKFDVVLRGSWMLDHCAQALFNCYEIVKADVMCTNLKYFSSVCSIQRDYCHNQWGMRDDYTYHTFQLYEGMCYEADADIITRRFAHYVRWLQ